MLGCRYAYYLQHNNNTHTYTLTLLPQHYTLNPTQQQYAYLHLTWYAVCCGAKNGHQKENGRRAQNVVTILGRVVDMMWGRGGQDRGPVWLLNEHENLHFGEWIRYLYKLHKLWGKWAPWIRFGYANHLALFACFVTYEEVGCGGESNTGLPYLHRR